jgi:hypothetical protein
VSPVTGLGRLVQAQWVHHQRRLWRQHDATLASAWRDPQPAAACEVIVLDDVPCDDAVREPDGGPSILVVP